MEFMCERKYICRVLRDPAGLFTDGSLMRKYAVEM